MQVLRLMAACGWCPWQMEQWRFTTLKLERRSAGCKAHPVMSRYPSYRINISHLCCQLMPLGDDAIRCTFHVEAASGVPTVSFGRRTANWCWFPAALQLCSLMQGGRGKLRVQMVLGPKGLPNCVSFQRYSLA